MHIGFTGTQRGMTPEQYSATDQLVHGLRPITLHHGDCLGADHEVHIIARDQHIKIHLHPPGINAKRAFCTLEEGDECEHPKPYLERNHDIVDAVEILIATPGEATEQLRSGTWSTVRYARKRGKPVYLVLPNGTVIPPRIDAPSATSVPFSFSR